MKPRNNRSNSCEPAPLAGFLSPNRRQMQTRTRSDSPSAVALNLRDNLCGSPSRRPLRCTGTHREPS